MCIICAQDMLACLFNEDIYIYVYTNNVYPYESAKWIGDIFECEPIMLHIIWNERFVNNPDSKYGELCHFFGKVKCR